MATEPTDLDHDTAASGRTWMECDATDCPDQSAFNLQYRTSTDAGHLLNCADNLYCPYHCAVRERAIRATPNREVARLDVIAEYFESWTPPRRYQTYNVDPERELSLLSDYLHAQDARGHSELESRIAGVEGALAMLRGDDLQAVIRRWDEPWKESNTLASGVSRS